MLLILLAIPTQSIITISLFCKVAQEVLFTAQAFAILNLIHTLLIASLFDPSTAAFQFQDFGIVGIDGISLWLIQLVNVIMPIVLLSTYKAVDVMVKNYIMLLISVGLLSLAAFIVTDVLLFYVSFEALLIPMYLIVGFYGSRNRKIMAGNYFFIYTLFGSLFMLIGVVFLYIQTGSTDYQILLSTPLSVQNQMILWLLFFIAFAIKVPMVPFHIWLCEMHVEAPTAASVILAAVLLKLGSYGFIRYSIPLFPDASTFFTPIVCTLCIIAIIYSSVACQAQLDMKKIIAYSSVGHMNTATIALFTNDYHGISAGVYFMISHGLISSALFLLIGVLYDRYHTRTIKYYRGLVMILPVFTLLFFVFTLANVAVPGTSGFISEFLTFLGALNLNPFIAFSASIAIVLAPAYALWLFHRVSYGAFSKYLPTLYNDITVKELHLFLPQFFLTMLLGIYPQILFEPLHLSCLSLLHYLYQSYEKIAFRTDYSIL